MKKVFSTALFGFTLLLLQACSGGSGSDPVENPDNTDPNVANATYTGPDPQTADIQAFRINVWENLRTTERCGACHTANGQSPSFVRSDDVNLAYNTANTLVDLQAPFNSRMVTKVAEGHNCWQGSDAAAVAACANIVEGFISAWANASGNSANVIVLTPPVIKDAGASKNFPADASDTDYATTVHPLLVTHCVNCHTPDAAIPQTPYFAVADVQDSYDAAQTKMDLDTPANLRFVVRLGSESHNCWTGNCQSDANRMEMEIAAMAGLINPTQPDPSLILSKALTLGDGILANTGGRIDTNVIARYEFQSGTGTTAFDTSGVSPELNLTLSGQVEWVGGWGIRIIDGKAQGTTASSKKLHDLINATGEYSIEAWVAPGNVTQGDGQDPARIVSYSAGTDARNFTLGQNQYNYEFLNRSTNSDANGIPALATNDDDEDLQATLQHVVVTYNPVDGRRVYVNGEFTGDLDESAGGALGDWNDTYAFVLGNEVSSNRLWQGVLRLVAVHNRALTTEQVQQNFGVGVGEKFFLLFSIGDIIDVPQSYIVLEVSQFDSYSYLFDQPFFAVLNGGTPNGATMKGMRIGINGREAVVGQTYNNLDVALTTNNQVISTQGSIIALEKGPEADEFFLTFEELGGESNVRVPGTVVLQPAALEGQPSSDIGVRTFDEINATMGEITGINIAANPNLLTTYQSIKQALPAIEDIETFLSSHQMSITQLAIGYCDALVETSPGFFPGVNFGGSLSVAQRSDVIDPLTNAVLGTALGTQPDTTATKSELNSLFDALCGNNASCSTAQTRPASKGVCAAAIANAAMLVQ